MHFRIRHFYVCQNVQLFFVFNKIDIYMKKEVTFKLAVSLLTHL